MKLEVPLYKNDDQGKTKALHKLIGTKNGKLVLYAQFNKTIYWNMQVELLFWKDLRTNI